MDYEKDIFGKFAYDFELSQKITAKPCISSMRSIVYHQHIVLYIIIAKAFKSHLKV